MRLLSMSLLAVGLACSPALAANDLSGCFKRSYDAAHLARIPGQQVVAITVAVKPASADGASPAVVEINATLRGSKAQWNAGGECKPDGDSLVCDFSDTGGGGIVARHQGGLRLEVTGDQGMGLEGIGLGGQGGERTFKYLTKPDDGVFLLNPAPAESCK